MIVHANFPGSKFFFRPSVINRSHLYKTCISSDPGGASKSFVRAPVSQMFVKQSPILLSFSLISLRYTFRASPIRAMIRLVGHQTFIFSTVLIQSTPACALAQTAMPRMLKGDTRATTGSHYVVPLSPLCPISTTTVTAKLTPHLLTQTRRGPYFTENQYSPC